MEPINLPTTNLRWQLSLKSHLAIGLLLLIVCAMETQEKDHEKKHPVVPGKGHLCIARFESTTGEPLYYTCPRPNESEKKSYCCYLDKCCDYKEFQKQTESQFKYSQANLGALDKVKIGAALKVLLWIVLVIILLIVGCCCLTVFLCRKRRLFQGGIFNNPLPARPPGPSPYAPPTNPYMAYQWPPETGTGSGAPPPAYPTPSYPPYPSGPAAGGQMSQPPFNPNFK